MSLLSEEYVSRLYQLVPNVVVKQVRQFAPGVVGVEAHHQHDGKDAVRLSLFYDSRWSVPVERMGRYGSPDFETGMGVIANELIPEWVSCYEDLKIFAADLLQDMLNTNPGQ